MEFTPSLLEVPTLPEVLWPVPGVENHELSTRQSLKASLVDQVWINSLLCTAAVFPLPERSRSCCAVPCLNCAVNQS
ncbi:hypothetical protein VTK56DRAFT_5174 [Thermocarpiscus australiensis]